MCSKKKAFADRLLTWYGHEKRDLPWRDTRDPYLIWISEVILQQTRVAQGLPYYFRITDAFPNVKALAAASEDEVLRLWQGLGYYSRARNMHQAAKQISSEHAGTFPGNRDALLGLKGVGAYTAAAVASFAFGEQVAVVDGNVYRVLARVYGKYEDIASGKGQKAFAALAQSIIPEKESAAYNQAIMEFGALQCVPKSPSCETCAMKGICEAYRLGQVNELPVKTKKVKVRERHFNYLIVRRKDEVMLHRRAAGDIWQGLYEPPVWETDTAQSAEQVAEHFHLDWQDIRPMSQSMKHVLTHQRIFAQFYVVENADSLIDSENLDQEQYQFFHIEEIDSLAKPRLFSKFLEVNGFI